MKVRCAWVDTTNKLYADYHDREWGVPQHNDQILFEFLLLEGAQAGLSWSTILNKRENYRKAFAHFDPKKISAFTEKNFEKLLQNAGIIRNKLKIKSAITNAQKFREIQKEFGSFAKYQWQFVKNKRI